MPFLAPFIPMIGSGLSIAGSALGSGSKTVKNTPTLSPELQGAESTDLATLTSILNSPDNGLGPVKQAGMDQINRNYAQMPQLMTQKLAARGFGSSGDVGKSMYDIEGSRLGDLSGLMGQMAQLGSNRQMSAAEMIQRMIAAGRGQNTEYPSNAASAGLTTASTQLGSLSKLLTLQNMLHGGGGGSTGSADPFSSVFSGGSGNNTATLGFPFGDGSGIGG
jgi:hypothetical protein